MNQSLFSHFDLSRSFSTLSANSNSQIVFTLAFLIFWSILYTMVNYTCQFKSLSIKDSNDTKNRIISIVHGVVSFWFAADQFLFSPSFKYVYFEYAQSTEHKSSDLYHSFFTFILHLWQTIRHVLDFAPFVLYFGLWICSMDRLWRYWWHRRTLCSWSF